MYLLGWQFEINLCCPVEMKPLRGLSVHVREITKLQYVRSFVQT